MSSTPCDKHGQAVRGKLLSFYVTLVVGSIRHNRKLRLCDECVDSVVDNYHNQWSDAFVLNRFNSDSVCNACGEIRGEIGVLHPFYVTCWNARQARFDYHAAYCPTCAEVVRRDFGLEAGDVQR